MRRRGPGRRCRPPPGGSATARAVAATPPAPRRPPVPRGRSGRRRSARTRPRAAAPRRRAGTGVTAPDHGTDPAGRARRPTGRESPGYAQVAPLSLIPDGAGLDGPLAVKPIVTDAPAARDAAQVGAAAVNVMPDWVTVAFH